MTDNKKRNKMTKDTVPEGFTWQLALADLLPVLFFGGTGVLLGEILKNPLVIACSAVVFLSGFLKVVWKFIVALKKKNIWPLFVQMRIVMPLFFAGALAGIVHSLCRLERSAVLKAVFGLPQLVFFILGIIGMAAMVIFAAKLDSSDPKSNAIEQTVNGVAQCCIFIGLIFIRTAM